MKINFQLLTSNKDLSTNLNEKAGAALSNTKYKKGDISEFVAEKRGRKEVNVRQKGSNKGHHSSGQCRPGTLVSVV